MTTLTCDDAVSKLLPHVDADFLTVWQAVGKQLGYRNIGRALARLDSRLLHQEEDRKAHLVYIAALEEQEVALQATLDLNVLSFCNYRRVSRFQKDTVSAGRKGKACTVEQATVHERLALQLRERGVKVEQNKRAGVWWADVEDEVWGADCWMTECFNGRYGMPGYEVDDALDLLREADDARRQLPQVKAEIAEYKRMVA